MTKKCATFIQEETICSNDRTDLWQEINKELKNFKYNLCSTRPIFEIGSKKFDILKEFLVPTNQTNSQITSQITSPFSGTASPIRSQITSSQISSPISSQINNPISSQITSPFSRNANPIRSQISKQITNHNRKITKK